MPLLNFKRQFVEPIREGRKCHTIRADRKNPVKPGDRLYLYCGARTKNCFRVLPEPVTCTKVLPVVFDRSNGGWVLYHAKAEAHVLCPAAKIDGQILSRDECEQLARCDGFDSYAEMMGFWDGRLPFHGQIIHWKAEAARV